MTQINENICHICKFEDSTSVLPKRTYKSMAIPIKALIEVCSNLEKLILKFTGKGKVSIITYMFLRGN